MDAVSVVIPRAGAVEIKCAASRCPIPRRCQASSTSTPSSAVPLPGPRIKDARPTTSSSGWLAATTLAAGSASSAVR